MVNKAPVSATDPVFAVKFGSPCLPDEEAIISAGYLYGEVINTSPYDAAVNKLAARNVVSKSALFSPFNSLLLEFVPKKRLF